MKCMLSTFDNEFDPFENFNAWLLRDDQLGHDSCGRVARIWDIATGGKKDSDMTEKEMEFYNELCIDFIISHDATGIFKKVIKK